MTQSPEELGRKIKAAQDRRHREDHTRQDGKSGEVAQATRIALRAGTDLVAALMVGGFLGYWIDQWLGSMPLFMVLFLFLGFGAGFLNIYRSQTGQYMKTGLGNTTNDTDKNAVDTEDGQR